MGVYEGGRTGGHPLHPHLGLRENTRGRRIWVSHGLAMKYGNKKPWVFEGVPTASRLLGATCQRTGRLLPCATIPVGIPARWLIKMVSLLLDISTPLMTECTFRCQA